MADPRDLLDDELLEDELEDGEQGSTEGSLSDEIARRWSPERLLKHVSKRAGKGRPLDYMTRRRYERLFGVDLGDVRIYTGEFAQSVTRQHSAEAVTVGDTGMIMMRGLPERSPITREGEALLAHELTHVAQAKGGIHPKSTGTGSTPLEGGEPEAEDVQQQVREDQGADTTKEHDPEEIKRFRAKYLDHVYKRVFELLEEDERNQLLRNGPVRMRP